MHTLRDIDRERDREKEREENVPSTPAQCGGGGHQGPSAQVDSGTGGCHQWAVAGWLVRCVWVCVCVFCAGAVRGYSTGRGADVQFMNH